MPESHVGGIVATLQDQLKRHSDLLKGVLSHKQRRVVASFIQQPLTASYNPQSGQIFGILKQMKETFETNLAEMQKEEAENQDAYESLKAAKESEIAAGTSQIEAKTAELADTDQKNADSKEDKENTQETLAADTKFLADLKDKCASFDAEYAARTKTRQLETQAVTKAMEFINSDEAHELFSKTLGLLQTSAVSVSKRNAKVAQVLRAAGARSRDPRLSAIATKVRLDKFTKVKETLENMITKLTEEKEEDIKQKDYCIDGFNKNDASTQENTRLKDKLTAKIEDLQTSQDELTKAIAQLKKEIADTELQMNRAGEDREIENKDYQEVIADQKATEKLLEGSLNILKGFYDKMALVQSHKQEQPEQFKSYEKNSSP